MCADNFSEERSLILRLIGGDEDAFCELYATYKNRLIYFAMRFLKSREYAEDVFQDAFTVVWQSRRFINPDASFSSYLYTIMRNRILNQLRNAANEEKLKESILSQALDYTEDTKREVMLNDRVRMELTKWAVSQVGVQTGEQPEAEKKEKKAEKKEETPAVEAPKADEDEKN